MLRREVLELRDRLNDSVETLRAISHGEVDALLISVAAGDEQVFTLSSADRPYRNFVENMSDGAATVSGDGIVLYANQALADLLGSRCQHIVGQPLLNLVALTNHARLGTLIRPGSVGGSVEANLLSSDGAPVPVLIGASAAFDIDDERVTCVTFTDLTSERQADAQAAHAAQHDALTGLLNRTLLRDRIEHALGRRASERSLVALLFCDVDGFKNINDSHGHQVGDDTLLVIAERLTSALRPEDTVARIGGDEFVVLLEGFETVNDVTAVARRVHAQVAAPMTSGPTEQVTISMGIAIASANDLGASPESLLRDADEAMYKAKRQGPNVIEMFDEQIRELAASRLQLLSEMRDAAGAGELRLYYQPVLDLRQERIVGVEALIRWQHPRRGLIPPNEFIPFAERSGLIIPSVRGLYEKPASRLLDGRAPPPSGSNCTCRSMCPDGSSGEVPAWSKRWNALCWSPGWIPRRSPWRSPRVP